MLNSIKLMCMISTWFFFLCEEKGCEYKAKKPSSVKQHKANVHDIDVTFFVCGVGECDYKSKTAGDTKKHKANKHDIDVTYHNCGEADCEYRAKQKNSLRVHKLKIHKIVAVMKRGQGVGREFGACVVSWIVAWYLFASIGRFCNT